MSKPIIVLRHLGKNKEGAINCAMQIKSVFAGKKIAILGSSLADASLTCEVLEEVLNQNVHRTFILADGPTPHNSRETMDFVALHEEARKADLVLLITHSNPARDLSRAFAKRYNFANKPHTKERKPGEWYYVDPLQRRVVESDELLVVAPEAEVFA